MIGQDVEIVADHTGHCFEIGEVVTITRSQKNEIYGDEHGLIYLGNERVNVGWLSAKCFVPLDTGPIDPMELL